MIVEKAGKTSGNTPTPIYTLFNKTFSPMYVIL